MSYGTKEITYPICEKCRKTITDPSEMFVGKEDENEDVLTWYCRKCAYEPAEESNG